MRQSQFFMFAIVVDWWGCQILHLWWDLLHMCTLGTSALSCVPMYTCC